MAVIYDLLTFYSQELLKKRERIAKIMIRNALVFNGRRNKKCVKTYGNFKAFTMLLNAANSTATPQLFYVIVWRHFRISDSSAFQSFGWHLLYVIVIACVTLQAKFLTTWNE